MGRQENRDSCISGRFPGKACHWQGRDVVGTLAAVKALIVGAGYVGAEAARRFQRAGASVACWVRTEGSAAELHGLGFGVVTGDVADAAAWDRVGTSGDTVVYCASTRGGEVADYEHIHGRGLELALAHWHKAGGRKFLYTSATSVYGQDDGGWVTEQSPTEPVADTSRVLLAAERRVREAGGVVLRVSGIYGPGRTMLLRRLEEPDPRLPGDGTRWINMVHRDDVAGALEFLAGREVPPGEVFNVSDTEPVTYKDFYEWLCPRVGKPVPPPGGDLSLKKRGLTNKRVDSGKLRQAGWILEYPTYREGYGRLLEDRSSEMGDGAET
jgi:nucleoside-diphosphate-sugar epimerase